MDNFNNVTKLKQLFSCYIIGDTSLVIQCANLLVEKNHKILGIISTNIKLQEWAETHQIPFYHSLIQLKYQVENTVFDYLFSIVNNQIIPDWLLSSPQQLAINFHDALLPRYAGVHATSWAILNNETEHGITWHVMNHIIDGGDILKQSKIPIEIKETAFSLNLKCYQAACNAFAGLVDELANKTYHSQPQDLTQRTYFGMDKKVHGNALVDWNQTGEALEQLSRALYFGHYANRLGVMKFLIANCVFIINTLLLSARVSTVMPGTITQIDHEGLYIATRTKDVVITQLSDVDGRSISLENFVKTQQLKVGNNLLSPTFALLKAYEQFSITLSSQETFWANQLAQLKMETKLPFYQQITPIESKLTHIPLWTLTIPKSLRKKVSAIFEEELALIILAIWMIYLYRINQEKEIKTYFADLDTINNHQELNLFIANQVPLWITLQDEMSFQDVLAVIKKQCNLIKNHNTYLKDIHQRYPELLEIKRPLIANVVVNQLEQYQVKSEVPIVLAIQNNGEAAILFAAVEVMSADFKVALTNIQPHLHILLEAVTVKPNQAIAILPLLRKQEVRKLLIDWNNINISIPSGKTVLQLFEEQVALTPEHIAITLHEEKLSYRLLNEQANQLARHLLKQGARLQTPIAICLKRSFDLIISLLAVLKVGGIYLPLDPEYPAARLNWILDDSQATIIITTSSLFTLLKDKVTNANNIILLDKYKAIFSKEAISNLKNLTTPNDLIYIIYTSGSTGHPKGVKIPHKAVVRLVKNTNYISIASTDRLAFASNPSFDAATFELWGALLNGATVIIFTEETLFTPKQFASQLQTDQVTILWLTAALFNQLIQLAPEFAYNLKQLLIGGEALNPEAISKLLNLENKPVRILNGYGPTESTTFTTCYEIKTIPVKGNIPIGSPISNTQVYVLDKNLQLLPIGAIGELYIAGEGLAQGYLNKPDLTNKRFISNPFMSNSLFYKSGDLVCWLPDGNLEFHGRVDNQVKIRGFRVELSEIEHTLLQHSLVTQAAAFVVKREDHTKQLVAFIVYDTKKRILIQDSLHEYLKARLPIHMIPILYEIESLPLTKNGKVDQAQLIQIVRARSDTERSDFVAPDTDKEQMLVKVWQQVFKHPISIDDDFFELGGDSIIAIQLAARSRQLGLQLSVKQIFEHLTIAKLALAVTIFNSSQSQNVSRLGPIPLTPIQHWFFQQNFTKKEQFSQACLLSVPISLNVEHASQCLKKIFTAHDVFHLHFIKKVDQWQQQYIMQKNNFDEILQTIDLPGSSTEDLEKRINEIAQQLQTTFDLEKGSLVKVVFLTEKQSEQAVLLFVAHHLIIDGISWRILLEEFERLYHRHISDEDELIENVSFPEWAVGLTEYANSHALSARDKNFWLKQTTNEFNIPVDYQKGINSEASCSSLIHQFTKEETSVLMNQTTKELAITFNALLVGTLIQTLAQWTNTKNVLIDLEGHGREDFLNKDVSQTIGWFTSLFPCLFNYDISKSLVYNLQTVQTQLNSIPHKGIDYGILQYLVQADNHLIDRASVSFNYWGQFDQILSQESDFKFKWLRLISHPDNIRTHLLTIDAVVQDGQLFIYWNYSKNFHQYETILSLKNQFATSLQKILSLNNADDISVSVLKDSYLLTPLQKGLLFHSLSEPGSEVYSVQLICPLTSDIDLEFLKQAFYSLMQRHSVLRSYFLWKDTPEPIQVILDSTYLLWKEYDWQGINKNEQETRLNLFLKADRRAGFSLEEPPLFRINIIKLNKRDYQLIISFHHILLDGWSISILLEELGQFYKALKLNIPLKLPAQPSFKNYINWLQQQDLSSAEVFWRSYLKEITAPTTLGFIRTKSKTEEIALSYYATEKLIFTEELTQGINSYCHRHKITLSTFLQGAWGLLLNRYNQMDDVIFGVTISGRSPELVDAEKIVGLLINTLPLRIKVDENNTVIEYLKYVQNNFLNMMPFSYAALTDIHSWSEIPNENNLFESIFVMENYPTEEIKSLSLNFKDITIIDPTHYPLTITAILDQQLTLKFSYNSLRIGKTQLHSLVEHFEMYIYEMLLKPKELIHSLELITHKEREQLLYQWNATKQSFVINELLHHLFEIQVNKTPDALALVFEEQAITYKSLNEKANQLAHYLQNQGLQVGELVAICLERGLEMVIGLLGILKAGGVYIPIDPNYPPERINYMLHDSNANIILTQSSLKSGFENLFHKKIQYIYLDQDLELIRKQKDTNLNLDLQSNSLMYVIYTSGSTGKPKGVLIEHKSVVNFLQAINLELCINQNDVLLAVTPISFDISGLEIYLPLINGAKCIIASKEATMDGNKLKKMLENFHISVFQATPISWRMLLETGWKNNLAIKIICGGEALSQELAKKLLTISDGFWNVYGPTETTIWSTINYITNDSELHPIVSIGKPIANTQIYILNKQLQLVPVGIVGEIYISGEGVARGYLNKHELTQDKFILNPFNKTSSLKLYKTGDLGRWLPNGSVEYIGRNDEQAKIRGFRIELGEIESQLNSYPDIQKAIVVVSEQPNKDIHLVSYLTLEKENHLSVPNLKEHLKQFLPQYMIPSAFIVLEKFPLTPNKKIDKKALPKYEQNNHHLYTEPLTYAEKILAEIWSEILMIPIDKVGTNDDFFELGGHSFAALQIISRIHERFKIDLEVRTLFENTTISQLAKKVESLRDNVEALVAATKVIINNKPTDCIIPLKPQGNKTPLFLIHPIGGTVFWYINLAKYLDKNRPFYGIQDLGVDAKNIPFDSIEEMADFYIKSIRTVQTHGPYLLGGASAGSNISVEMAYQLQKIGEEVAFVALLDGWAYYPKSLENQEFFESIMRRQYNTMQSAFIAKGIHNTDRILNLQWQRSQMMLRHRVPYVRNKLTLFKAADVLPIFRDIDSSLNHWQSYSSLPIDSYLVPGDHETMFQEPNVPILAKAINKCFENINEISAVF